jgi:tRNA1(Val) A37 N6-methylase TrmN6
MPLFPGRGAPAGRIVVRAVRGSRAPLLLMPGVVLHGDDGKPTPLADLLLNGNARLPFQ